MAKGNYPASKGNVSKANKGAMTVLKMQLGMKIVSWKKKKENTNLL